MRSCTPDESAPESVATIGRVVVEVGGDGTFRVCEADGSLCYRWVPWELPQPLPLDRGGFTCHADAVAFALGVCWERAYHGLLPESTEDIDREREALDRLQGRIATKAEPEVILAGFTARIREYACPSSLDGWAAQVLRRMEPEVQHHPVIEPIVERRTLRRTA
jgi:hypothetical protein